MTKDYYKILEVTEFSTQDEIKRAYRKLARKWHPDVAGNSSDVISMFKEINEAYELLSNPIKKADYDKARKFYNYAKKEKTTESASKNNYNNATKPDNKNNFQDKQESKDKKSFSFSWEDFLAKKHRDFQFKKEKECGQPKRGNDVYSDIEISVFEAVNGTKKIVNMLQTQACPICQGRKFVNGGVCSHCKGSGEVSEYKRFSVKIPACIKDKSKIRLAGEGEKGVNGGQNGDLYLIIHILEPKNYKTEGLNILKTIQIAPYEAVLGTTISVPTMKGNVMLKIPQNSLSGDKIRLSGCGIETADQTGDMIVTLEIQLPKKLSIEEFELYKRLGEISSSSIRV